MYLPDSKVRLKHLIINGAVWIVMDRNDWEHVLINMTTTFIIVHATKIITTADVATLDEGIEEVRCDISCDISCVYGLVSRQPSHEAFF